MNAPADHHEELAALHALGLLEGAELAAFEAELANNADLRRLVAELRTAASDLAHAAPPAMPLAPAVRARLLATIATHDAENVVRPAAFRSSAFQPFSLRSFLPWAAAACLAVTAFYLAQQNLALTADLAAQRLAATDVQLASRSLANQLAAEQLLARAGIDRLRLATARVAQLEQEAGLANLKLASLASLLGDSPAARAIVVWNPVTQEGVLDTSQLPALASDRDYQLWIVDPQYPIPVDGGVFRVDPATGETRYRFKAGQLVKTAAKFAVSLERKGGVPKAEGPMVLLSQ